MYVLCFTSKVDKQTDRAFSIEFLPFVYFLFFAAFVQNQSHFGFFLGIFHRFGLKFSRVLLTYINISRAL